MIWKKFCSKMGALISEWLDEIGAKPTIQTTRSDLEQMTEELEKSINRILKMPEFESLVNTLFQNIIQRNVAVKSTEGNLSGVETNGFQQTCGTIGGRDSGEGTATLGDEEGTGFTEDQNGETPIERVNRRVRGLVKIGYDDKPEDVQEGWTDPGKKVIIVNIGHPAWKIANGLTLQARDERVRVYHIIRTVFSTLVEETSSEAPKETLAKLFSSWYNSCIKG